MSIKGTSQELYVGKKESNIISFFGNKKKIEYNDLSRIDYMLASGFEVGYIDFEKYGDKTVRFEFNKKANEKIAKTIELISENNQELDIYAHDPSEFKFYQHTLFGMIISFILGFPLGAIGLFIIWYYKKGTRLWRVFVTVFAITFWGSWIVVPYMEYKSSVNQLSTAMSDYQNTINGISQSANQLQDPTIKPNEEKEYTPYSVADMIDDLNANALNASEKYKDQYVEITGKLRNIDSDGKYISLDPDNDEFNLIGIQCNIKDDTQKNKVSGMIIGDPVTLKGKITSVGEVLGYSLDIDEIE